MPLCAWIRWPVVSTQGFDEEKRLTSMRPSPDGLAGAAGEGGGGGVEGDGVGVGNGAGVGPGFGTGFPVP